MITFSENSIDFTDLSTNDPFAWEWIFDGADEDTVYDQNPTAVEYNVAGTYDVVLTATNFGGSDTEIKTDYITELMEDNDLIKV